MSVIDEVKQKLDIVEVISQFATLTKSGRTFRALCPFHSEKNPSFYVYPEQQSWHCFGACSTGGDVFSFVMKKENIDFGEALRLLAQRAGVTIPSRSEPDKKRDERERLYQANEAAAQYFHNLLLNSTAGEKARNYLASRGLDLKARPEGLSPKAISDFQLGFSLNSWEALEQYLREKGYTEDEMLEAGLIIKSEDGKTYDRFRNKLMFPINDSRGRPVGFGARVLDDSLPKYINSPQTPTFDKSGSLYGINLAAPAIRQQNVAVIVEGYMDVITAHQNGFSNVIASMGTAITEKQVNALKRLNRNVSLVLGLDADEAGEEAMLRCVDYENTLDTEVKVVILPEGKDPDDVIREDIESWQHLLDKALPVIEYATNMILSQCDLTTATGKSSAVSRCITIYAKVKDSIKTDHYLTKLSQLLNIPYPTLEAALKKFQSESKTRKLKSEELARAVQPLLSHPAEEDCLASLLQHPELKSRDLGLLPEYFENSENREIFIAWQQVDNLASLKENLDAALWEHLDTLINLDKGRLATQVEERYNDYVRRLREEYLKGLARKRAAASEAEGTVTELPKEQDIEIATGLREVYTQKARRGREGSQKNP